jgi:hypothetical protein
MSWNDIPAWDKNRAIHFQIGLICALGFSYLVINYESKVPIYNFLDSYSKGIDVLTTEVKSHSEKQPEVLTPVKQKVNVLIAKLVETNEVLPEVGHLQTSEVVQIKN